MAKFRISYNAPVVLTFALFTASAQVGSAGALAGLGLRGRSHRGGAFGGVGVDLHAVLGPARDPPEHGVEHRVVPAQDLAHPALVPVDRGQPQWDGRGEAHQGLDHRVVCPGGLLQPGQVLQVGAERVALDISGRGVKVFVFLNGKRLEPTLVEMARSRGMMVCMPSLGVSQRQPTQETRQFTIFPRPDDQMPMIGHEAVGQ